MGSPRMGCALSRRQRREGVCRGSTLSTSADLHGARLQPRYGEHRGRVHACGGLGPACSHHRLRPWRVRGRRVCVTLGAARPGRTEPLCTGKLPKLRSVFLPISERREQMAFLKFVYSFIYVISTPHMGLALTTLRSRVTHSPSEPAGRPHNGPSVCLGLRAFWSAGGGGQV